jgi:hypothetical protein
MLPRAEHYVGSLPAKDDAELARYPPGFRAALCNLLQTGYWTDRTMVPTRHFAAVIAALTTCVAAGPSEAQPESNAPVVTCTNPVSGATWQILIDYERATVDANPADVSDTAISWRDARDGGHYTLDRTSGNLTVIMASSTGGYFLHDHCRLPP